MKKRNYMAVFAALILLIGCLVIPPSGRPASAADKKLKVTCSSKSIAVNCSTTIKTNVSAKFSSSDQKIATVSSKGVITGKKAGKVKITVTSKSNKQQKETITITVKNQFVITAPEKAKATLETGNTLTIKANLSSTFKSNHSAIASVSKSGVVTAREPGTAKITVTSKKDKKLKKTVTITVIQKAEQSTENNTADTKTTEQQTTADIKPQPGTTTEAATAQSTTEAETTEKPTTEEPTTEERKPVGIEANYRGSKVPNDEYSMAKFGIDVNLVYNDGSKEKIESDYTYDYVSRSGNIRTYKVESNGFTTTFSVEVFDTDMLYPYSLTAIYNGEPVSKGEKPKLEDFEFYIIMNDLTTKIPDTEIDKSKMRIIYLQDYPDDKEYWGIISYDYTFTDENGNELFICLFTNEYFPYK
ncbi:MAG: Ig-like domain-containing protein [Lachnospiraceae bacterium]